MSSPTAPRPARWPVVSLFVAGLLGLIGLGGWLAYELHPGVNFRVQIFLADVYDVLNPRPDVLPTPVVALIPPTPAPTATASPVQAATRTGQPPASPEPTATTAPPTATAPPLPASALLEGFKHEYQKFNNCGPASLAITLSFWGWQGSQAETALKLKPVQDDKNVSPREMYEYMLTIGYDAYIRVNGDVATLKRFIAAGYPVLVEKGLICNPGERCDGWFGHYSVFVGYDDAQAVFITQDSYRGPNLKLSYDDLIESWRSFNYIYVVPFPAGAERDAEVLSLLGPAADVDANYRAALERSQQEALTLTGEAAAFAWFNVGTNLHNLQDYAGAAAAYDQARQIGLPYRMVWYQFGPYRSYYYMARYHDVVELATFGIEATNNPGLEEAYYWRGLANVALGFRDKAIADFRTALDRNPNFAPARQALLDQGVQP